MLSSSLTEGLINLSMKLGSKQHRPSLEDFLSKSYGDQLSVQANTNAAIEAWRDAIQTLEFDLQVIMMKKISPQKLKHLDGSVVRVLDFRQEDTSSNPKGTKIEKRTNLLF